MQDEMKAGFITWLQKIGILTHQKKIYIKWKYGMTDSLSVMVRKKKSHRLIKFAIFKTCKLYKTSEMVT